MRRSCSRSAICIWKISAPGATPTGVWSGASTISMKPRSCPMFSIWSGWRPAFSWHPIRRSTTARAAAPCSGAIATVSTIRSRRCCSRVRPGCGPMPSPRKARWRNSGKTSPITGKRAHHPESPRRWSRACREAWTKRRFVPSASRARAAAAWDGHVTSRSPFGAAATCCARPRHWYRRHGPGPMDRKHRRNRISSPLPTAAIERRTRS